MLQGNTPRRSRPQQLTLAAALGLALVGITQCRGVSDRISGLDLHAPRTLSMRSSCARRCNEEFRAALLAEQARYLDALRACGREHICRSEEERAHLQQVMVLMQNNRQCKRSCYNEGGGRTGD